ncbi:hypothetical protein FY136_13270 [Agrobacterium tumefaciens]|uniref:hypothetical protein n=1 Tax=Agrobacterium tumefaciens TaxID=358 RepID=UPI0021D0EA66|nr:hypothetical protein [Agrobacterium tumefaciens]UXT50159.1 hypothetical protein FY136_13270 [Agrobacterium tumefaciens]
MPNTFKRSISVRLTALALLTLATTAQANQPDSALVGKITKDGFFGSTPYNKYVAHDIRVSPDGRFTGLLEWESQNSVVNIVGMISGTTISFKDTGYVKKGSAKVGCEFSLTIDDESIGAEGTYQGCGGSPDVRKAWAVFGTREQYKAYREADVQVSDAQFAVAAADYAAKNCPTLRVNWTQVGKVAEARGWTVQDARKAKYYAQNMANWTKQANQPDLSPDQNVCYLLKAQFVPPMVRSERQDMARMITGQDSFNPFP